MKNQNARGFLPFNDALRRVGFTFWLLVFTQLLVPQLLVLSMGRSIAAADEPAVDSTPTATDPLETLRDAHPRLLFLTEDQERIQDLASTEPLLARLIRQNRANATQMLEEPTIRYEIPDGKRLLAQSRKCIRRVVTLAMAYRLSGDSQFARVAIDDMLVAASFSDWNPSHFLDTAEMTTALAIGYDWLYPVIEPADRRTIQQAIIRLGLREGQQVYRSGGWWTQRDNNWNQVCNGGMILGALAIAEHAPELASEIITAAIESSPPGLRVYEPSGAYPEGPGYWQYGTTYTCLTISGLTTALGTDFGLRQAPGLSETGNFRLQTIGPTGAYFNYADGGSQSRLASAMFLLARVYDRPVYAQWHRARLAHRIPDDRELEASRFDRFFPLEIAWFVPRGSDFSKPQLPLDAFFSSQQDIVTMRNSWGDVDAIYVGFKGGDNQTNHGHLDVGSFVLDASGVRWAIDLGADNYNLPGFFGNRRWQYYRLINHSHNTLVINGKIQNPQAVCRVVAFDSKPDRCSAIVDMTDAYKGQVDTARRGIELVDRKAVHVRDEISGVDGTVRWAMVTRANITLDGNTALLRQDGQTLFAQILSPRNETFEIRSNKPSTAAEKQNEGTRILAVETTVARDELLELSVLLQPMNDGDQPIRVDVQPLSQWPNSSP